MAEWWENDAIVTPQQTPNAPTQPGVGRSVRIGNPDPRVAASEARAQESERRAKEAADRAAALFLERNQPQLQAGYRWKNGVVGGEQELIPTQKPPKQFSDNARETFEKKVAAYIDLRDAILTFKDDYAGNVFGGTENALQSVANVGTPGQREWWATFKTADNKARNELFGASLSGGEKSAYGETTVGPNVTARTVKENLERRLEQARQAIIRESRVAKAANYDPDVIDALTYDVRGDIAQNIKPFKFSEAERVKSRQDDTALLPGGRPRIDPREGVFGDQGGQGPNLPRLDRDQEREYRQFLADRKGRLTGDIVNAWWAGKGFPNGVSNADQVAQTVNSGGQLAGINYAASDAAYNAALDERNRRLEELGQDSGLLSRAASGTGITDELAGVTAAATGGDYTIARDAENRRLEQMRASQGVPGYLAEGGGALVSSLPFVGAAERLPAFIGNFGRAAIGDAAFGAGYGAAAANPGDRLGGAATGSLVAPLGTAGGTAAGKVIGATIGGVTAPVSQRLSAMGARPTIGQIARERGGMFGNTIGRLEDYLTSVPVLGSAINARRVEGLEGFNQAAFNQAVEGIPGDVSGFGRQAIDQANMAVSNAYDASILPMRLQADPQLANALANARNAVSRDVPDTLRGVVDNAYETSIRPFIGPNGEISGEGLQAIKQGLDQEIADLKGVPGGKAARDNLRKAKGAVFDLAERQEPDLFKGYRAADKAFKNVQTVTKAAESASGRAGEPGLFTGAQLANAAKASERKYGPSPLRDLAEDATRILPSQVPDSGTTGRLLAAGLAGGAAGAGSYYLDPATGALIAAATLPFTRPGQAALRSLAIGNRGPTATAIGDALKKRAYVGGMFGAPLALGVGNQN